MRTALRRSCTIDTTAIPVLAFQGNSTATVTVQNLPPLTEYILERDPFGLRPVFFLNREITTPLKIEPARPDCAQPAFSTMGDDILFVDFEPNTGTPLGVVTDLRPERKLLFQVRVPIGNIPRRKPHISFGTDSNE